MVHSQLRRKEERNKRTRLLQPKKVNTIIQDRKTDLSKVFSKAFCLSIFIPSNMYSLPLAVFTLAVGLAYALPPFEIRSAGGQKSEAALEWIHHLQRQKGMVFFLILTFSPCACRWSV